MRLISFSLVKDMILYTGGSVIGRIVTLFLLPWTTSYLTPSDYGVIGMLTLATTLLNGLFTLGFHTSLGRVFTGGKCAGQQQGIIWTAFIALVANNALLSALAIFFSGPISCLLLGSDNFQNLIPVTVAGLSMCSVRMSFEYYLRATGKSKVVFCLNIADVALSISVMLLEIIYLQRGALGYMEAIAISQGVNLAVMLSCVARGLHFSVQWQALRDLVRIGAPCIFGYLSYCILQGASRYILQMESTEEQVGFYFLGSNIGKVIELPLWGFMGAWVPLFNSYVNKQSEAPQLFSKVMTYYLLGMSFFIAPLFCLARPVVHTMMQAQFHGVWTVVGLSALSQALWGAYAISYPPLIFHQRTGIQSVMEIGAAIFCIALNLILVPLYQKEGAVVATLSGFLVLLAASIWINGKILYVQYEGKRIGKIVLGLGACAALSFFPIKSLWTYNVCMILLLLVFYFYCWVYVLTDEERSSVRGKLSLRLASTS